MVEQPGNSASNSESDEVANPAQSEPAYRWPVDEMSRQRRVEAVLLMARKPLNSRKISQLAELEDGTQARTLVRHLNRQYDQRQQAFHIKRVAGGYQMRTRPQFAAWIRKLDHVPQVSRLSTPALETLTVVAYRQPIIKADIEAVRGVSCGEMLRQLLDRGLIKIAGRSEQLGRPFYYATSKEFLTQFGFRKLQDLPRFEQLSGNGLPNWVTSDDNRASLNQTTSTDSETLDLDLANPKPNLEEEE